MTKTIEGKEYYQMADGSLVPSESVRPIDQLRDQTVERIIDSVNKMRKSMSDVKRQAMDDIDAYVRTSSEQYGISVGIGKGNLQLNSLDGTKRVQIAIHETIGLKDENVAAAKELIDQYLRDLTKDSNADIRTIVNRAFRVSQGNMDIKRILDLRNCEIGDPLWKKAMTIIGDGIYTKASQQYIRCYEKNASGQMEMKVLDFGVMEPEKTENN